MFTLLGLRVRCPGRFFDELGGVTAVSRNTAAKRKRHRGKNTNVAVDDDHPVVLTITCGPTIDYNSLTTATSRFRFFGSPDLPGTSFHVNGTILTYIP